MPLFRSSDQGANWGRASSQPGIVGQGVQLLRVSDNTGWVVSWTPDGDSSGSFTSALAVTRNGGQNWQQLVCSRAPPKTLVGTAAAPSGCNPWVVCGGGPAIGQESQP